MAEIVTSSDIFNSEQIKNNIKIYAGPGAGKTHFIVENIKNIISTNIKIVNSKARKILCVTYTNAAVDEIKKRLDKYTNYADIFTIHSFIFENIIKLFQSDLIRLMKSDFDIDICGKGSISSQIEGLGILHGINKEDIFSFISKENGICDEIKYSKKIMGEVEVDNDAFITSLNTEGNAVRRIKASDSIAKSHIKPIKKYVWSVVRKLTHNEILYFGYRILETNRLAAYYLRVKYPFVFVDEFQDTNPLQTLTFKLLCSKSSSICVVGDVAQSIYSFQGAKPSDFEDFCINSEDKEYVINGNRRSTENIVNFCNFIRQEEKKVLQQSSNSVSENRKIHFLMGTSQAVFSRVSDIIDTGGVVLTRTWASAFEYIKDIEPDQIKLLKAIYNSYYNTPISIRDEIVDLNNVKWVRAFKFVFKLWESYRNGSFVDLVLAYELYGKIDKSKITAKTILLFNSISSTVFDKCENLTTCQIICRFNEEIVKPQYKLLNSMFPNELEIHIFDELDKPQLKTNISNLSWTTSYKLFNDVFSENSKYMTVHQAKGLEWKKVIVSVVPTRNDNASLCELFSKPSIKGKDSCNEFVRIFYVACSRAIEDLYIHIAAGVDKKTISNSLDLYIKDTERKIEYEFIE